MAPEILKGQLYDSGVDMWSLGVTCYVMLCGYPPFDGENDAKILCNIMNIKFDFPEEDWKDISENAKNFIKLLLTTQDKRPTAKEMMNHSWFKNLQK